MVKFTKWPLLPAGHGPTNGKPDGFHDSCISLAADILYVESGEETGIAQLESIVFKPAVISSLNLNK